MVWHCLLWGTNWISKYRVDFIYFNSLNLLCSNLKFLWMNDYQNDTNITNNMPINKEILSGCDFSWSFRSNIGTESVL
jgi:hypothetical protein